MTGGSVVGRTFSSFYSPSLRRAIALAQIEAASPDAVLTLAVPPTFEHPALRNVAAHIADLPFLPAPDQIAS
jgi:glycine cleavage system aminomethyltransferase T